jgi:Flp pilus assembly protein TadD
MSAHLQRNLAEYPGDERTLNELGAALENSGNWQQAQKVFLQNIACIRRHAMHGSTWLVPI